GIPGIGETLQEKITTLVISGELPFHAKLLEKTPLGLVSMLRLPGLGPKKVKALYDQLGIQELEELRQACLQGRIADLKGFGKKTQDKILEGIQFLGQAEERLRLDQALDLATALLEGLQTSPGIERIELCGSLRRRKETIRDIDLLVSSRDPRPIM